MHDQSYRRVLGWTAIWYALPLTVYLVWAFTRSGAPDPSCSGAIGTVCPSGRVEAVRGLVTSMPQLSMAVLISVIVAVLVRLSNETWRASTIALIGAVLGGGLMTIIGRTVTAPTTMQVGRELADLIKLGPTTVAEVLEARMLLELSVVPLMVTRATDEEIAELRRSCERQSAAMTRHAYSPALSADFHLGVAACAHNTAIDMLVQSFHVPLQSSLEAACASGTAAVLQSIVEHEEFVAALERRDSAAAVNVMRRHLGHLRDRRSDVPATPVPSA